MHVFRFGALAMTVGVALVLPSSASASVTAPANTPTVRINGVFGVQVLRGMMSSPPSLTVAGSVGWGLDDVVFPVAAGKQLRLQRQGGDGRWHSVARNVTNGWGRYDFYLNSPRTGHYRVALDGRTFTDAFSVRRTSSGLAALTAIWPDALPTPVASRSCFWASVTGRVWGKDRRALVQRLVNGRWRTIQVTKRVPATETSNATLGLPPLTQPGLYRVWLPGLGMSVSKRYLRAG